MTPLPSKTLQRLTRSLSILAGMLLFVMLFNVRVARIANTPYPFFSLEFIALVAFAIAAVSVIIWQAFRPTIHQTLAQNPAAAIAISAAGFMVLALANALYAPLAVYRLPFIFWWALITMVVLSHLVWSYLLHIARLALWQQLWQLTLSLAVLALVLEVVLRLWFSAFGSEQEKINYLYSQEQILAYSRFEGLPYVNFGLSSAHQEHTANGLRKTGLPPVTAENRFVIAAIGGSTTYGVGLAVQDAYPAQLQKILHERGYTHVEVLNAGVPQYATTDNLVHLALRVLDAKPNLIITYEGINDVVTRLVDPAQYDGLNRMRGIWQPALLNASPSVLVRFVGINLRFIPPVSNLDNILANVSHVKRCVDATFCANLGLSPQEVLDQNPPIYFRRNLRNIIALAKANGINIMLSSWAYYPEKLGDYVYMTYPHIQSGVAQHNAITQELAQEMNVPFYDLYVHMPYGEQYWLDGFHMSVLGAYEQASRYADFLLQEELISAP